MPGAQDSETHNRYLGLQEAQVGQLLTQKTALEQTLKALTEEVECLSVKNQRLISDLRHKDFFDCYNKTIEELEELRKAHAALIETSCVRPQNFGFRIKQQKPPQSQPPGFININYSPKNETEEENGPGLLDLISCGGQCTSGDNNRGRKKKEAFEAALSKEELAELNVNFLQGRKRAGSLFKKE